MRWLSNWFWSFWLVRWIRRWFDPYWVFVVSQQGDEGWPAQWSVVLRSKTAAEGLQRINAADLGNIQIKEYGPFETYRKAKEAEATIEILAQTKA